MSRDATVSDWIDLLLVNDSGQDVVVNATVKGNKVTFDVYGQPDGNEYRFETRIIRKTEPPEPVLEYVPYIEGGLESRQISPPKCGYVTELVRYVYKNGERTEATTVRRDVYRGVAAKVQVKESMD